MRVKTQADDFHLVPLQCVIKLTRVCVPNLSLTIEGSRDDLVTVGVVERHRVNDVRVVVETEELLSRVSVPYFARAIVASSDKLVTALVKRAICQWEQMGSEHFEKTEALLLVFLLLFDQFFDELLELWFASLRNERFLKQNLVDKAINIRPIYQI